MPDQRVPHADVAGYVLGTLDAVELEEFSTHLAGCSDCRAEVAELASVRLLLDRGMPPPELPPHVARRTFAAIEDAAAADTPEPVARPVGTAPRGRRRARRRFPVVAATALAGVAALVVGLFLPSQDAPRGREITLVATPDSEGAGVARLHREAQGVVVELTLTGMAVPADGAYYECWYVAEDDTREKQNRLTAGTFSVAPQGATTIRMTTAADHEHFPRIEVTLEPGDGDPRATGPVVLHSRPRSDS